jgi:hypothetical protein
MEIVLPFRTPNPEVCTEARSTLIIAALQTLRARGLYDAYVERVSPGLREELMSLVAGIWVPIELAVEHYRTMERLELPKSTIEAIGAEVAERGFRTVLASPPQPLEGAPTPWDVLRAARRNLVRERCSSLDVVVELSWI